MTIYERIKQRRKELELSADDVAAALGVSRATVYRYESSDIEKLPTTVLEPLSKILSCSPGYLMGWEDEDNLSKNEETFISLFRKLNDDGQSKLLERARELFDLGYIR